ncbi:MAG TPA: PLDc N-terminal domain-containing protein, partial [Chitinophagaceae bacterium]|nr:PLDc N-terminal domain-containing protein [Chitinophagaceae bacterium]
MNWWLIVEIVYLIILVLVCLKVIYDTRSHVKTLAYLLLVIFVPVFGIVFYFSFGINYRKHKLYSKKLVDDVQLASKLEEDIFRKSKQTLETSGP